MDVSGDHPPCVNIGVLNAGKALLGREMKPTEVGVLGSRFTAALLGVRNDIGAGLDAALLLSKGSFLTASKARFNFCAERSAFNAAAVVTATWGITADGFLTLDSENRLSREPRTLGDTSSLLIRCWSLATSPLCCVIEISMLRKVRFTVSKDGAFRLGLPAFNSASLFLEDCRWSSSFCTRSLIVLISLRSCD